MIRKYNVKLFNIDWDREVDGTQDTETELPDAFEWSGNAETEAAAVGMAIDAATDASGFCILDTDSDTTSEELAPNFETFARDQRKATLDTLETVIMQRLTTGSAETLAWTVEALEAQYQRDTVCEAIVNLLLRGKIVAICTSSPRSEPFAKVMLTLAV